MLTRTVSSKFTYKSDINSYNNAMDYVYFHEESTEVLCSTLRSHPRSERVEI